jgi:hypothetical protein
MIFRYLSGIDIYFSFYNLNIRFNRIISNYHYFSFDFRSISKLTFDSMMQYIQPLNIYALTLSNYVDKPGQIELFLSCWKLSEFVNLRSLHLHHIIDESILPLILSEIIELSNLVDLRIDTQYLKYCLPIKPFFQLTHLKSLCLPCVKIADSDICPPFLNVTHIHIYCSLKDISLVFKLTPFLRSLSIIG